MQSLVQALRRVLHVLANGSTTLSASPGKLHPPPSPSSTLLRLFSSNIAVLDSLAFFFASFLSSSSPSFFQLFGLTPFFLILCFLFFQVLLVVFSFVSTCPSFYFLSLFLFLTLLSFKSFNLYFRSLPIFLFLFIITANYLALLLFVDVFCYAITSVTTLSTNPLTHPTPYCPLISFIFYHTLH